MQGFNKGLKIHLLFCLRECLCPILYAVKELKSQSDYRSFGRLSVPAGRKWEDLFDMCCVILGCSEKNSEVNTARAWEKVASVVAMGRKNATDAR